MYPSDISKIAGAHARLTAYLTECARFRDGNMGGIQDSLAARISCCVPLNEAQVDAGVALLGHRCHARTKAALRRALSSCPQLLNHGIYRRLHIDGAGMTYCAGQDYPAEIVIVRRLLAGHC